MKEHKIGDIFNDTLENRVHLIELKEAKSVKGSSCSICAYRNNPSKCNNAKCFSFERKDKKSVYYNDLGEVK